MDIQILGSYPEELSYRFILSSYLVNGELAIDAGALGLGLTLEQQEKVENVVITHTHIDHLASLPIFIGNRWHPARRAPSIFAVPYNVAMLKKHVFNNILWPDLQSISDQFYEFHDVEPYQVVDLPNYTFYLFPVNHPVPTYGVLLQEKKTRQQVLFTSDTSICDVIWIEANRSKHLKAIFSEISFPDSEIGLAQSSGHMTPSLLIGELKKLRRPVPIYLTHYKNQHIAEIEKELAQIHGYQMHICQAGEKIHLE